MTTIKQYPLDRKKIMKRFVSGMIIWTILAIIAGIFLGSISMLLGIFTFLGIIIIFSVWTWIYENKYFQAYFYDVGESFLVIRKDWITPRETMLPYEKLQDVYMDQDLFDRMFGLWDVHVSTATMMSGMAAHIDGVNSENAQKIRELIMGKIKEKGKRASGYD
ncbi:MAG: PH domain-containing protein [Candidatus Micrarchaeota archaeon]|nr:PH domain-containing protein [Candidatus Micrarchaeota archaeon]